MILLITQWKYFRTECTKEDPVRHVVTYTIVFVGYSGENTTSRQKS